MAFLTGSEIYILRTIQTNHGISWSIYLLHTYIKQFYKSHNAHHHHWCQLHAWCMISYLPLLDNIHYCKLPLPPLAAALLRRPLKNSFHPDRSPAAMDHISRGQRKHSFYIWIGLLISFICIIVVGKVCSFYLIFLSNESGYEVHIVLVHPLHHLHHIQSYQYHHCWKPPWHYCDYCPSSPSSACGLGPRLSSVHLLKTSFQRSN